VTFEEEIPLTLSQIAVNNQRCNFYEASPYEIIIKCQKNIDDSHQSKLKLFTDEFIFDSNNNINFIKTKLTATKIGEELEFEKPDCDNYFELSYLNRKGEILKITQNPIEFSEIEKIYFFSDYTYNYEIDEVELKHSLRKLSVANCLIGAVNSPAFVFPTSYGIVCTLATDVRTSDNLNCSTDLSVTSKIILNYGSGSNIIEMDDNEPVGTSKFNFHSITTQTTCTTATLYTTNVAMTYAIRAQGDSSDFGNLDFYFKEFNLITYTTGYVGETVTVTLDKEGNSFLCAEIQLEINSTKNTYTTETSTTCAYGINIATAQSAIDINVIYDKFCVYYVSTVKYTVLAQPTSFTISTPTTSSNESFLATNAQSLIFKFNSNFAHSFNSVSFIGTSSTSTQNTASQFKVIASDTFTLSLAANQVSNLNTYQVKVTDTLNNLFTLNPFNLYYFNLSSVNTAYVGNSQSTISISVTLDTSAAVVSKVTLTLSSTTITSTSNTVSTTTLTSVFSTAQLTYGQYTISVYDQVNFAQTNTVQVFKLDQTFSPITKTSTDSNYIISIPILCNSISTSVFQAIGGGVVLTNVDATTINISSSNISVDATNNLLNINFPSAISGGVYSIKAEDLNNVWHYLNNEFMVTMKIASLSITDYFYPVNTAFSFDVVFTHNASNPLISKIEFVDSSNNKYPFTNSFTANSPTVTVNQVGLSSGIYSLLATSFGGGTDSISNFYIWNISSFTPTSMTANTAGTVAVIMSQTITGCTFNLVASDGTSTSVSATGSSTTWTLTIPNTFNPDKYQIQATTNSLSNTSTSTLRLSPAITALTTTNTQEGDTTLTFDLTFAGITLGTGNTAYSQMTAVKVINALAGSYFMTMGSQSSSTLTLTNTNGLSIAGYYDIVAYDGATPIDTFSPPNATDQLGIYMAISGISPVSPSAFPIMNTVSFSVQFNQNLNTESYFTNISAVNLIHSTGAQKTMILGTSNNNLLPVSNTGINLLGLYDIQATDSARTPNILTKTGAIKIINSITNVTFTPSKIKTAFSFVITFYNTLGSGVAAYSTISKVGITNTLSNTYTSTSFGSQTTTKLTVNFAVNSVPVAGWYTVTAYDSDTPANPIIASTPISVYMALNSVSANVFKAGSPISFDAIFNQNLNTGDPHTTLQSVAMTWTDGTHLSTSTTVTMGIISSATISLSLTSGLNRAGEYNVDAYDNSTYNNKITLLNAIQIYVKIVSFTNSYGVYGNTGTTLIFNENMIITNPYTLLTGVQFYDINDPTNPIYGTYHNYIANIGVFGNLSALSSYWIKATISAPTGLTLDTQNFSYYFQTTMAITAISRNIFRIYETIDMTITFSHTFDITDPFKNIHRVSINNTKCNGLNPCNFSAVIDIRGTNTIHIRIDDGITYAEIYQIQAMDGNDNPIFFSPVYITMAIGSFTPVIYQAANNFDFNYIFDGNTVDKNQDILYMYKYFLINIYTGEVVQMVYSSLTAPDTLTASNSIPNYGDYQLQSYDGFDHQIINIPLEIVRITIAIVDIKPDIFYVGINVDITITFSSELNSSNTFARIEKVYIQDINNNLTQLELTQANGKTLNAKMVSGIQTSKKFQVVVVDGFGNNITNTKYIFVIPTSNCLLDESTLSFVVPVTGNVNDYQGRCYAECPSGFLPDDTNLCIDITTEGIIIQDNRIVNSCSEGYVQNDIYCISCKSQGLFYFNTNCFAICPTGLGATDMNICTVCTTNKKYLYQHNCIANCPTLTVSVNGECVPCPDSEVWYKGRCEVICPSDSYRSGGTCIQTFETQPTIYLTECLIGYCDGGCINNLQYAECVCKDGEYGLQCEYSDVNINDGMNYFDNVIGDVLDSVNKTQSINSYQVNSLLDLNTVVSKNPGVLNTYPDIVQNVKSIVEKQIELGVSDKIPIDPNLILLSDVAFNLQIAQNILTQKNTTLIDTRKSLEIFADTFTQNSDKYLIHQNNTLLGNQWFKVQVGYQDQYFAGNATAYGLSKIGNISGLENILKSKVKMMIIDYKRLIDTYKRRLQSIMASDFMKFKLYVADVPISITENVGEIKINVTLPVSGMTDDLIKRYELYSSIGVDIFNPNSLAFTSRCFSLQDPETLFDTTLNYRIGKYFSGVSVGCGSECRYVGFNKTDIICECSIQGNLVDPEFNITVIPQVSNVNIGLVLCNEMTIVNVQNNRGFWVSIALLILIFFLPIVLSIYNFFLLDNHIDSVIRSDCLFYDGQNPSEYFSNKDIINDNMVRYVGQPKGNENKDEDNNKLQLNANMQNTEIKYNLSVKREPNDEEDSRLGQDMSGQMGPDQVQVKNVHPIKIVIESDPESKNDNLKSSIRMICLHDYDKLNADDSLLYDDRSFWKFFLDFIMNHHILFSLFNRSILSPYIVRAFFFVISVSSLFFFNAFLYFDSFITNKGFLKKDIRVFTY
jgi:hypothetical protein